MLTIWHIDPESGGSDDSCGWVSKVTKAQREQAYKLGTEMYGDIFGRRSAFQGNKDYAHVCFEPSTYEAVYWVWCALKHQGKKGYRFGKSLSAAELEFIMALSSEPLDNLQSTVARVNSAEVCGEFFYLVERARLRFIRKWYQHPRWHVWHWRLQWHHLQAFKRWAFSRCQKCGGRFTWGYSPISQCWHGKGPQWFKNGENVFHHHCSECAPAKAAV